MFKVISGCFLLIVGCFKSFLACCKSFKVISCLFQVVSGGLLLVVGPFRLFQFDPVGPPLAASLEPLANCINVTSLSRFCS